MAQLTGTTQVVKYFESTKAKRFKIFTSARENLTGVSPLFEYVGTSANDAKNKLTEIVELLEEGGDGKTDYSLHCFNAGEEDDKKKSVITFKVSSSTASIGAANPQGFDTILSIIKDSHAEQIAAIKEENKELKIKLEQFINDEEDDDEIGTPQTPTDQLIAGVMPFLPMIAEKLIASLTAPRQGVNVNGVPPNNKVLSEVVNELLKHDPDLQKHLQILLNVAIQDPEKFKQILSYLTMI